MTYISNTITTTPNGSNITLLFFMTAFSRGCAIKQIEYLYLHYADISNTLRKPQLIAVQQSYKYILCLSCCICNYLVLTITTLTANCNQDVMAKQLISQAVIPVAARIHSFEELSREKPGRHMAEFVMTSQIGRFTNMITARNCMAELAIDLFHNNFPLAVSSPNTVNKVLVIHNN